jgi:trehalose 6-phosphate synthase/phosphatase
MLKSKRPELKVGFFLHIPFPVAEIYRELPQRKEILESLLTCDQLGFQDLSYLTHFKTAVDRIQGHKSQNLDENKWGVYPVSIETEKFIQLASDPKTTSIMALYAHHKNEKKWVLGIDRLDSIKGLILKFRAFEFFLKKNPELAKNTQLVQLVIPSRSESLEAQKLKAQIEELVSNINGQWGSPFHTPILYLYKSINDFELSAFYQLSEVMHISSSRDGMNLVGLEYIASQKKTQSRRLLLSEFAGAHSSLSFALSINPWDIHETADKLKRALEESGEKQGLEMTKMQEFLKGYNSSDWARVFLSDLSKKCQNKFEAIGADDVVFFPWMKNLRNQKVMIFCDFDGTLAPLSPFPHQVKLAAETEELLERVYHHRNIELVIVSGRDRDSLQKKFATNKFHFPLAACHGAYHFTPDTGEWSDLITADSTPWRTRLNDILNFYTSRTPESYFEDKGHSTTWHYRHCPQDFAEDISNKLFVELRDSLATFPVQITRGKKTIEISSLQANKGHFIHQWLKRQEYHPDIIIALGDDNTDEDMFDQLQSRSDFCPYCIKVGLEKTNAQYFIKDQTRVNALFKNLLQHIS